MPGRKTRLTRNLIKEIAKGLREGATAKAVLAQLSVPESTYYYWLERGERAFQNIDPETEEAPKGEELFLELLESKEGAFADLEFELVSAIKNAEGWKSKAWLLEKRFPEAYGKSQRVHHSGEVQQVQKGPKEEDLSKLSDEELAQKEAELIARKKALEEKKGRKMKGPEGGMKPI